MAIHAGRIRWCADSRGYPRVLFRVFLSRPLLDAAKQQSDKGLAGRMEGHAAMDMSVKANGSIWRRIWSEEGRTAVSDYFVMDWASVWVDIVGGLLIAGALAAWVPKSFWQTFFLSGNPWLAKLAGPIIGPFVAIISFVCSVGNVPLAAVLWNGGASFGGVIAFIFADLIVLPILDIYRRYYGLKMSVFLLVTFYVAMALVSSAHCGVPVRRPGPRSRRAPSECRRGRDFLELHNGAEHHISVIGGADDVAFRPHRRSGNAPYDEHRSRQITCATPKTRPCG
jgi:hypothetical protein